MLPLASVQADDAACPVQAVPFLSTIGQPLGVRELDAVEINRDADGQISARGNVQLDGPAQSITATQLRYDPATDRMFADEPFRLTTPDLIVEGSRLEYEIANDRGTIDGADYWLRNPNARSGAARGRIERLERDGATRFSGETVDYTTCPGGNDDWVLSGRRIDVDQAGGFATARDVTLRFKGVPLLYSPWLRFPVDDQRHTGFLPPTFRQSDRLGAELQIPFYWNIAPNRDALITARPMSRRGVLIETEWRMLQRWGLTQLDVNVLPSDQVEQRSRRLVRLQTDARLGDAWSLQVDATDLSDPSFLRDFGGSGLGTETDFVERRLTLTRPLAGGLLQINAQGFQIANPLLETEPYQRLPQIRHDIGFGAATGWFGGVGTEWTRFARSVGVTGDRFDLDSRIGYRWQPGPYYVEPRAGLRLTRYALDQATPDIDRNASRVVPEVSVEAGAQFDRPWNTTGIQTLEPRLFYGYVPFRDQSRLPLFDSSRINFDLDRLFTNQRFVGADRIGDIHQASALVTTRFLDTERGLDRFALSGGYRRLLSRQRVEGPGTSRRFDPRQALLGRLEYAFNPRFAADFETGYDLDNSRLDFGTLGLRYRSSDRSTLGSLVYRYRANDVEQVDVSGIWPASRRTRLIARYTYDVNEGRDVDLIVGLMYQSCCYGLRLLARRSFEEDLGRHDQSILVQFTLDGLSRYDTGVERTLRESILGYEGIR